MNGQAPIKVQTIQAVAPRGGPSRLINPLLICSVALMLALVLIIGVVRLFHSLNDGTISAWRLLVLFANIFGCVTLVCALYSRGCQGARSGTFHRGRAS
ncbi:MAG: hypothetical protein ACHQAQ_03630 [Hyphomicrobiales bacterium]